MRLTPQSPQLLFDYCYYYTVCYQLPLPLLFMIVTTIIIVMPVLTAIIPTLSVLTILYLWVGPADKPQLSM